jgi:hypothetical protein
MNQQVATKRSVLSAAVVLAVFALSAAPASAHHSGVMFDSTKNVTLTGTVKEFQYTNPHSWLLIDVTGDNGKVTTWGFEAEGPSTLMRNGIRRSDFKPGTKVTVTAHPMKDGRPAGEWSTVVRVKDNKTFCSRGCGQAQP